MSRGLCPSFCLSFQIVVVCRRRTFSVPRGHTGRLLPQHNAVAAAASLNARSLPVSLLHFTPVETVESHPHSYYIFLQYNKHTVNVICTMSTRWQSLSVATVFLSLSIYSIKNVTFYHTSFMTCIWLFWISST